MRARGSILIVGVGGQGVLLAADVLAAVCLRSGWDVKKSDVHGMAQRGGIVFSHVRFAETVHSPLIAEGSADALVALEWAEALRWLPYLKPGGTLVTDQTHIVPPAACADRRTWRSAYPPLDLVRVQDPAREVYLVDGRGLAKASGVAKAANIVLLGALSRELEFDLAIWEEAIRDHVPAGSAEANIKAFHAGRAVAAAPAAAVAPAITSAPAPLATQAGITPQAITGARSTGVPAAPPRRFRVEVTDAWCKGCDICVRVCPEDCLRLNAAAVVRCIVPDACTGCRLCELLCPDFAISVVPETVAAHG